MLAVSVFTFPGQGLSVDNNMATGTKPASSKMISRSALQRWPPELLENYEFEYDDPNEKAIKATCIVCNKHSKKFQAQFKGKVVQDVVNYSENGITYLLKPNLERHLNTVLTIKGTLVLKVKRIHIIDLLSDLFISQQL